MSFSEDKFYAVLTYAGGATGIIVSAYLLVSASQPNATGVVQILHIVGVVGVVCLMCAMGHFDSMATKKQQVINKLEYELEHYYRRDQQEAADREVLYEKGRRGIQKHIERLRQDRLKKTK